MGRAHRIPVNALGLDLLSPPLLQSLVYAEDEWTFSDERL
jgi:hypothetical protein